MHGLKWADREKKIARKVFDAALQEACAAVLLEFKRRAVAASSVEDAWATERWLADERRRIDARFDFRYSQLIMVCGGLLREQRINLEQLDGLGADKLVWIERVASL